MNIPKQYADRIQMEPNSGCWLWTGATKGQGRDYGYVTVKGKHVRIHRLVYHELVGHTKKALHHTCEVQCCVNPDHLIPVTPAEHNNIHAKTRGSRPLATHCKRGHKLSNDGAYREPSSKNPRGWRLVCRACKQASRKAWRTRRRAAGLPVL